MPQLDKLAIITQIFWLSLFFFSLYFFSLQFFTSITYKRFKLYTIMGKNYYNLTKAKLLNNFNSYSVYTYTAHSFLVKPLKIRSFGSKQEFALLSDTAFVFDYPHDVLYFYDVSNNSIISKNYEV